MYRTAYANELFNTLLAQPWTAAIEEEAFALLDKLAAPDEPAGGLYTRVAALHRLTDAMLEARFQAGMKAVEHPDKLTRTELQKKHDEFRKAAREGFAARLRAEAAKQRQPFAQWITAERVWIDVLLERDLKQVAAECWAILDAAPPKANPDDVGSAIAARLDELLRARILVTLENLAARKDADAALVERLAEVRRSAVEGQAGRRPLAGGEVPAARRARPREGTGSRTRPVGGRPRPGQPVAAGLRLPARRTGEGAGGDQAVRGARSGRRTQPRPRTAPSRSGTWSRTAARNTRRPAPRSTRRPTSTG